MSQTQSLYQRCLFALDQLLRLDHTLSFYNLVDSGRVQPRVGLEPIDEKLRRMKPPDPMRLLWDLLALGVPLCILYNAQSGVEPLQIDVSCEEFEWNAAYVRHAKRGAALFIMGVNSRIKCGEWDYPSEIFTISELLGNDTNGFVKVVDIVLYLLERLPESRFSPALPALPSFTSNQYSDPFVSNPSDGLASFTENKVDKDGTSRNACIQSIIKAERKYVADLEVMHKYAQEIVQKEILTIDTVHRLFPGLSKLLDFGRKFLIEMEGVIRRPWEEQRWGELFIKHDKEFEVYQPYCANYADSVELMMAQEQNLMSLTSMINPRSELPMLLIKPIQKVWTYQLLLQDLVEHIDESIYPYYGELKLGVAVAKRITNQANEAQRKVENRNKVKMLETRVEDWKGHVLAQLGELLNDAKVTVNKSGVDRKYHVFLFEKIIFCFRAPSADEHEGNRGGVMNLKRRRGGSAETQDKSYLLKGRVFLYNVTKTSIVPNGYSLKIWWRGDNSEESMILCCRNEEQRRLWQTDIDQLVAGITARRSAKRAERTAVTKNNADQGPTSSSLSISPTTSVTPSPASPTNLHETQVSHPIIISSFMSIHEISQHLCQHGCQDVTTHLDIDSFGTFPLSSGGFGDIYRGRFKSAIPIAIKTMCLQISPTELGQKSLKYAARELHIWSKCQHPNVLPLLGLVIFRDQIGMASRWLERGSLPLYIEQNPGFDPCKMSTGIASGLAYLHSAGIVHGDLKGLNILVSDDGAPMLTDFGNAVLQNCTLNFTATTQKSSLSLRWAAPELLDGRADVYSTAADVYALGMTVLETFTGKVPFFGSVDIAVMSAVIFRKEIPARPEAHIPPNSRQGDLLWSLLKRCWAHEPKDRPSSLEVESEMREITYDGLTHDTTLPKYI